MANRFWVGGTANWDGTAGTKWAATSGGAGGETVPGGSDAVFLDGNSGAVTVTKSALGSAASVDFTGFTGTFAGASTLAVIGNITLGAGMTWTHSGNLSAGGSCTFTSNGKAITSNVAVSAAGSSITLADDFSTSGSLTLQRTFNANSNNATAASVSVSGTLARTITMGSGTWTLTGTGTIWDATDTTNLTLTSTGSTIKATNSSASSRTFISGGLTYNNFLHAPGAGTGTLVVSGGCTFADFKDDGTAAHTIQFTASATFTFTTFTVSGASGNLISLRSTSDGTFYSFSCASGTISCDFLSIKDCHAAGGATWNAGSNSLNVSGNAGWVWPILIGAGSFGLTGQDVALRATRVLQPEAASFALSGQDTGLVHNYPVSVDAAAFSMSGQDVEFFRDYAVTLGAGSFSLSGQDVSLHTTRALYPDAAAFTLSGQDVAFVVDLDLQAERYVVMRGKQRITIELDGQFRSSKRLGGRGQYAG